MTTKPRSRSRILKAVDETFGDLQRLDIAGPRAPKVMRLGLLPPAALRQRVIAIARGDYHPKASEPKVWFTSMKVLAAVLSDDNRALLRVIVDNQPASIAELARSTGCTAASVSRRLKSLSRYGIVELRRERGLVRPVVNATEFQIDALA